MTAALRPVRQHRLFAAALGLAAVLRVLVAVAYAPALGFFGDSYAYIVGAHHPFHPDVWHPLGYPVLLWVASLARSFVVLTTVQHLLGLLTGLLVYRLVRRLGVGAAGATLAAVPVLFDAYQLDVEQLVLADTVFTFLLVLAMTLTVRLLRRPALPVAAGLGALLAAATLTRTVGLVVALTVGVLLLVARPGWRRLAVAAVAFAVPVGAYVAAFDAQYGAVGLQGFGGRFLYGVIAPEVTCSPAALPAAQRPLCPTQPRYARPGSNQYVWEIYPVLRLAGDPVRQSQTAQAFTRTAVLHHPGVLARPALANLAHYFEPGRSVGPRDWFVGSWQFPLRDPVPAWNVQPLRFGYRPTDQPDGRVVLPLATVLRDYQRVVFTPGPLLLVGLVLALLAAVRGAADVMARRVAALLAVTGVLLLAVPAVSAGFDWRYLLPAQVVLAPAGVLGAAALREPARRMLGRALPPALAALAVVGTVPGWAFAAVPAASRIQPVVSGDLPGTRRIGTSAQVSAGLPQVLARHCWALSGPSRRWVAAVEIPIRVTYRSGPPLLVQPVDLGFADGRVVVPKRSAARVLPFVLMGPRDPVVTGGLFGYVWTDSGVLRYVDPLGRGAGAWRFRLPSPAGEVPGSPC